jgi:23S rRNA-intervening sequence protein
MSDVSKEKTKAIGFENLDVFKRAYAISLAVHRQSLKFPSLEQYGLAEQVRRASKGICANIAEGFAKQVISNAEFKRFLAMAYWFKRRNARVAEILLRSRLYRQIGMGKLAV